MPLSEQSRVMAGTLLVAVPAIELGGQFLLRIVRGHKPATDFQRTFFRAGHAHAGVLVTLALVSQLSLDGAELDGLAEPAARLGIAWAAILMPAGSFLSVTRRGATEPNRLVVLIWLGAASLAAGSLTLGIGLLTS